MKYKIKVTDENSGTTFFEYESYLQPMPNDEYAGSCFDDRKGRVVISRLIIPNLDGYLLVMTKLKY
jgi:hypothetical protein